MNTMADDENQMHSALGEFGFARLDNAIEPAVLKDLRIESGAKRTNALRATEDGIISYSGFLADLGAIAQDFLTGQSMRDFLHTAFGDDYEMCPSSSCYTYYEAGDFLSAHKDGAQDCEVTVLVYLEAGSPRPDAPDTGLKLEIYEDVAGKPDKVRHAIGTRAGSIIVGRGTDVWHGRPQLLQGEHVHLLTACFTSTR